MKQFSLLTTASIITLASVAVAATVVTITVSLVTSRRCYEDSYLLSTGARKEDKQWHAAVKVNLAHLRAARKAAVKAARLKT